MCGCRKELVRIALALEGILDVLHKRLPKPKPIFAGGTVYFGDLTPQGVNQMIRTQDDHADQPITLEPVSAVDAEGNTVPLTNDHLVSTDEAVVSVVVNPDSSLTLHIGAPGTATINRMVTDDEGTDHTVFAQAFAITAGPPATFTGGGAKFGDLVDTP